MKHIKWILGICLVLVIAIIIVLLFRGKLFEPEQRNVYYVEGKNNILVKVNEEQFKEITQDGISIETIMERDGLIPETQHSSTGD